MQQNVNDENSEIETIVQDRLALHRTTHGESALDEGLSAIKGYHLDHRYDYKPMCVYSGPVKSIS